MKTIGLIGGMSWESSAEYYRLINQGMKARLGGHNNARSLMLTVNFEEIKALQHEGRWQEAGERMADAARRLESAGADFIVLCTNTMHKVAATIEQAVAIPLLHVADAAGEAIRQAGLTRVGLLATSFTMEHDFYRDRLASRFGIDLITPDRDDRTRVHDIIYDELCHGNIRDDSRREYQRIVTALQSAGADGIILGCTEIGLLIKPADIPLPSFDTTMIHCQAAISMALGKA